MVKFKGRYAGGKGSFDLSSSGLEYKEYIKKAPVKAVQINLPFTVETIEGAMSAQAGDYLCEGPAGECWPVAREIFESTYEEKQ